MDSERSVRWDDGSVVREEQRSEVSKSKSQRSEVSKNRRQMAGGSGQRKRGNGQVRIGGTMVPGFDGSRSRNEGIRWYDGSVVRQLEGAERTKQPAAGATRRRYISEVKP